MGTRSHVVVMEGSTDGRRKAQQLVRIYRQFDGNPAGMGQDIKVALNDGKARLVNGFSGGDKVPKVFNGMGCLAAYLVGALKSGSIGNVYIDAATKPYSGIEWEYILSEDINTHEVLIQVRDVYEKKTVYNGPLATFNPTTAETATV